MIELGNRQTKQEDHLMFNQLILFQESTILCAQENTIQLCMIMT